MAYAKQVLAMVRNHAEGENEQFLTVALQAAAVAARRGHRSVAEDIRTAVKKAQSESSGGAWLLPFHLVSRSETLQDCLNRATQHSGLMNWY